MEHIGVSHVYVHDSPREWLCDAAGSQYLAISKPVGFALPSMADNSASHSSAYFR